LILFEVALIVLFLLLLMLFYLKQKRYGFDGGNGTFFLFSIWICCLFGSIACLYFNLFLLDTFLLLIFFITTFLIGIIFTEQRLQGVLFVAVISFIFLDHAYNITKDMPYYIRGDFAVNEGRGYLVEKNVRNGTADLLSVNGILHNTNCFSCKITASDNRKIFRVLFLPNSKKTIKIIIKE
jgi:hypothetical protein